MRRRSLEDDYSDGGIVNWGHHLADIVQWANGTERSGPVEVGHRAALAHPLLGLQSDMDPDYQEFQILLAKVSHIDGFSLEWVYPGDASADSILRSMMTVARRYDFRLGVNWIEGSFFDWMPKRREDVETREDCLREYGRAIEYLIDDIYRSDIGIVVDGHPLILLFSGPNAPDPEEFAAVLDSVLETRHGPRPWFLKRGGSERRSRMLPAISINGRHASTERSVGSPPIPTRSRRRFRLSCKVKLTITLLATI